VVMSKLGDAGDDQVQQVSLYTRPCLLQMQAGMQAEMQERSSAGSGVLTLAGAGRIITDYGDFEYAKIHSVHISGLSVLGRLRLFLRVFRPGR
jgi:hypothetical protein